VIKIMHANYCILTEGETSIDMACCMKWRMVVNLVDAVYNIAYILSNPWRKRHNRAGMCITNCLLPSSIPFVFTIVTVAADLCYLLLNATIDYAIYKADTRATHSGQKDDRKQNLASFVRPEPPGQLSCRRRSPPGGSGCTQWQIPFLDVFLFIHLPRRYAVARHIHVSAVRMYR